MKFLNLFSLFFFLRYSFGYVHPIYVQGKFFIDTVTNEPVSIIS